MPTAIKSHKHKLLIILGIVIMSFGYALTSNAQYDSLQHDAGVPVLIHKILLKNGMGAGGARDGYAHVRFSDSGAMKAFYSARENKPVWTGRKGDTEKIRDILAVLENSWLHGLNPDQYHVKDIKNILDGSHTDTARLDLLVTDAVMRFGHDITGMRINPQDIKQRIEYWRAPLDPLEIMEKVSGSYNPAEALEGLAPQTALYKALQKELVRLLNEQSHYDHVLPMSFNGDHHFTPGEVNKDVESLRVRLGISHREEYGSPRYYDDDTAAAVMKFQRQHGLEPDGIIGPQTLAVLNRTNRARMEQLVANMERLRWLEQERPERYILVNIAQQLLWAVENGRVAHEMEVVVGLPYRRTKEFKTEVTGVRINPTWTVPINLKMTDFLPKLKEDPNYLAQKQIEVIQGYGYEAVTLDPATIDWHNIGWKEMGKLRFVQTPGDHNALGAVRILMPNRYNIYMHDTNHPEYFERGQRTYSSGCIRLSEPKELANFILKNNRDWSNSDLDELIGAGEMTEVETEKPFPVYIIYQSIWLDERGRVVYGSDVYKRDRELIEVLRKMDGYKLSESHNNLYTGIDDNDQATLAYNR